MPYLYRLTQKGSRIRPGYQATANGRGDTHVLTTLTHKDVQTSGITDPKFGAALPMSWYRRPSNPPGCQPI